MQYLLPLFVTVGLLIAAGDGYAQTDARGNLDVSEYCTPVGYIQGYTTVTLLEKKIEPMIARFCCGIVTYDEGQPLYVNSVLPARPDPGTTNFCGIASFNPKNQTPRLCSVR